MEHRVQGAALSRTMTAAAKSAIFPAGSFVDSVDDPCCLQIFRPFSAGTPGQKGQNDPGSPAILTVLVKSVKPIVKLSEVFSEVQ